MRNSGFNFSKQTCDQEEFCSVSSNKCEIKLSLQYPFVRNRASWQQVLIGSSVNHFQSSTDKCDYSIQVGSQLLAFLAVSSDNTAAGFTILGQ